MLHTGNLKRLLDARIAKRFLKVWQVVAHVRRLRRHQTCYFRKYTTSAAAELGGKIHNVSGNRARTQVLLQAQKLHVYGSGTCLVPSRKT